MEKSETETKVVNYLTYGCTAVFVICGALIALAVFSGLAFRLFLMISGA